MITEQRILEVLRGVPGSDNVRGILEGCSIATTINGGHVGLILEVHKPVDDKWKNDVQKNCEQILKTQIAGITNVTVAVVHKKNTAESARIKVPGVKSVIIVVSGKGGVGKSTFATHFALALARLGYKSALVDADICGSSVPRLLGCSSQAVVDKDGVMSPMEECGIKSISIGNIIDDENKAIIWRGPLLAKAIKNLLLGTQWGSLDYMVIDTPPGTGDVHITLAKSFEITGAVVVTTPHTLSVIQASRTCDMLRNLNTRLLGVVENMSYFLDHDTGHKSYIFGESCVRDMAKREGTKILGEIVIDPRICELSEGNSLANMHDDLKSLYEHVANNILLEIDA